MAYPHQLTIQLRKYQLTDIYGNPIYFAGPNPMSLSAVSGAISNPWIDFTDSVSGLNSTGGEESQPGMTITFTVMESSNGSAGAGQTMPKRTASNSLSFERDAYEFIKSHLVDDVAAGLNKIEVRVNDIACGSYDNFIIKSSDLEWCEYNALCVYEINIKQADELYQCIERTMIADNWQGWFQDEPVEGTISGTPPKYHPRFSYCVEHRPNGVLIVEWFLSSIIAIIAAIIVPIISVIVSIITAIGSLFGGTWSPPVSPTTVLSSWANMMFEAAGCGREHPAPLIRDYITNVCDKCGVKYDSTTADIFFSPTLTLVKSDGATYTVPNPHYNACYFYPSVERGIRRFRNWNLLTGFVFPDTTTYYQPSNAPVLALSDFLSQLKGYYNAEWIIQGGWLFFKRKDYFYNQPPDYDFSAGGADRSKIIEGICYQQQEFTIPASMNGLYQDDPSDKCGHEAKYQMNGDPLSFGNTINNPAFYGILDKNSGFGATRFNCDGAQTNYIYDALQITCDLEVFTAFLSSFSLSTLAGFIKQYADYALLLQTETVTDPKILIWDGFDYLNAKAVKDVIKIAGVVESIGHSGYPGTIPGITTPDINPRYPSQVPAGPVVLTTLAMPSTIPSLLPWETVNEPKSSVYGRIFGSAPAGVYEVADIFGSVSLSSPAALVNYPAYFNPYFKDTLWDWFHWIDDPYRNPKLHKTWNLKIPLCKEDLEKLKLLGDGKAAKLLRKVLLDTNYYNQGLIKEITVSYDVGQDNGTGQYIELKGEV